MTWDGKERRDGSITISDVENAVYKANEKFFAKVQEMCDKNMEVGLLRHTTELSHLDKETKSVLYEMIGNFKGRIKAKYSIGIPLSLLIVERVLNKIGLF